MRLYSRFIAFLISLMVTVSSCEDGSSHSEQQTDKASDENSSNNNDDIDSKDDSDTHADTDVDSDGDADSDGDTDTDSDSDSDLDTGTDADVDGDSEVDTDVTGDAGSETKTDTQEFDCESIPDGPFALTKVESVIAAEDLAFDDEGNLVGSDERTIYKTKLGEEPSVFVPNINFRAGLRYLPNGDLVVANNTQGTLLRITPDGVQHVVLSGLSYPNGIEVDQRGLVYLTEQNTGKVLQVDPIAKTSTIVAKNLDAPNGVTFNPTYDTLYIGCFSGAKIVWKLPIDENGNPGERTVFATNVGSGMLDGMGVDVCGNVYVCDYGITGSTQVIRISPDGATKKIIINRIKSGTRYLPNLQWGSGIGGWDPMKIYLPGGLGRIVWEADIGVPSKPRVFP